MRGRAARPAITAAATLMMSLSILLLVVANVLTQASRRRSRVAVA